MRDLLLLIGGLALLTWIAMNSAPPQTQPAAETRPSVPASAPASQPGTTLYRDSDKAFNAYLPPGWRVEREEPETEMEKSAYDSVTRFKAPVKGGANVQIMTAANMPMEIPDDIVPDLASTLIDGWAKNLRRQVPKAQIGKLKKVKFRGRTAVRCDYSFVVEENNEAYKGYFLFFCGKHATYLTSVLAPTKHQEDFAKAEAILNTLVLEPKEE